MIGQNFIRKTLQSDAGFNLVELMIAAAISGIISLSASTLYVFIMDNFRVMVDQNAAQESVLWSSYQSKSWLQQARSFTSPMVVKNSQGIGERAFDTFFLFERESSPGGTGAMLYSQISVTNVHNVIDVSNWAGETGTIFVANENPYGTMGVLGKTVHFRSSSVPIAVGEAATWNNSVFYDKLSQYDILGFTADASGTSAVTISVTSRYFYNYSTTNELNYCFPATHAACANGGAPTNRSFRDINMVVTVGLRNLNYDETDGGLHGNIYYYRFMAPPVLLGLDYN